MAMREEFDKYLLLKKLSEDPLGETFRAGRVGNGNLDQVVLLRALNGPRLDTGTLAETLPDRAAVQQALKSPNIGNGVDLGVFRGVPFVAYDYISGRTLASLVQQAEKQMSPIAVDHALLIAERIALALAVAYETRVGGERLTHGFLLPHLVRVSNEGETRVLGFEIGPLLAEQAQGGTFEPEVSAYLAPEVVAGQPRNKSDDVYSLGAILFELLTGERPSSDTATRRTQIEQARSAEDDQPLAPPLVTLLQKSLCPRDQRMPEPVTWHKALSNVVMEGEHTATTFNLAFFMHNLFREEIERETQEMEAEKDIEPPEPASKSAATVAMSRDEIQEALEPPAEEAAGTHPGAAPAPTPKKKGGAGLWIGVAAVLLLVLGGGAAWYFIQGPGAQPAEPETTATEPAPVDPEPVPEQPQGPTVEELQAQIQEMLDAREQEMQDRLQATYDDRLQELQQQLEQAKADSEAREQARQAELERLRAEQRAEQEAAAEAEEEEPEEDLAATREPTSTTQPQEPEPTRTVQTPSSGTTGAGGARTSPPQTTPPPRVETKPEPAEPEPMDMTPPILVERPDPRYPAVARRVGREATVILRVLVDDRGRVQEVQQISKKAGFGIDQAAIQAAEQATYRPGTEDGKPKEMWTTLRFTFRP